MKITVDKNISYQTQQGVILGDNFLDRKDFEEAFKQMLKESQKYEELRYNLANAKKIISIIKKGKKVKTITEFTQDLEQIVTLFSGFMMGLGGDISLLTTFNFGKKSAETYFLANEKDLPSSQNAFGQKTYYNTLESLKQLQQQEKKLSILNKSLNSHLQGFYNQLTKRKLQTEEEYQRMRVWSYYNMPERYKSFEKKDGHYPVSMGQYFWGKGHIHGYASEAFGTHLVLIHPNALMGSHISDLKRTSVITEHGGAGSTDLFDLLLSTKGNISSQLSGDIVLIDQEGKVLFNIQSKASRYGAYEFTITYKKFVEKMMLFLDTYDKYANNIDAIQKEDVDALFKAFSTQAWVPISKEVANKIDQETNRLIEQGIPCKSLT